MDLEMLFEEAKSPTVDYTNIKKVVNVVRSMGKPKMEAAGE